MVYKSNFITHDKFGFTVVEMLIIISIIGLLSASMLSNQRSSAGLRQLNLDVQKVVQDIRKAQSFALSSQLATDCSLSSTVPYGVVFDVTSPDRYIYVADCDESKTYSPGDIVLQTVILNESELAPSESGLVPLDVSGSSVDTLNIFFDPPLPQLVVNGDANPADVATQINICQAKFINLCKTISITSKGAVSTQ